MKKILYQILLLLVLFITINTVNAKEEILTFNSINNYNVKDISNVFSNEEGFIFSSEENSNTIIYKYDKTNTLKISKQLEGLKNAKIIKKNQDYLVSGISENSLKVYLLDSNLQIKNQIKTSNIINYNTEIKLYNYKNKIYLMLTEEGILSNNIIYEIDDSFNLQSYNLSTLGSSNIKEILKGDYYLIYFNSDIENNLENNYLSSTYLEDKYILVGNKTTTTDNIKEGLLSIVDKNGNKEDYSNVKYQSYKDVKIIKDKLIVLANNEEKNFILTFNFNGELIDEEEIELNLESYVITNMYKLANQIAFTLSDISNNSNEELIMFYNYNLSITKENSNFGTINIEKTSTPYSKVNFEVVPNSGYEVDNIIVKDTQGNQIDVLNQSFIMPENDVYIAVTYKENIVNPETLDLIILIFISVLIVALITFKLYKKMSWLRQ